MLAKIFYKEDDDCLSGYRQFNCRIKRGVTAIYIAGSLIPVKT